MKSAAALFLILMIGTLYGQECPRPTYRLRAGDGQQLVLNYSSIYHLGGADCSGFDGHSICQSGMAFGMMPGMPKKETQLDNKYYEFKKVDCSTYSIPYSEHLTHNLDTTRFSGYKGHSRDLDHLSLPCRTSEMDLNVLFDQDTLVSMTLTAFAYGGYNTELLNALTSEFNFRYGPPVDSLMNGKTGDPDYIKNVYTWSATFCGKHYPIKIHQLYNVWDNVGEELIIEFLSDQFKRD